MIKRKNGNYLAYLILIFILLTITSWLLIKIFSSPQSKEDYLDNYDNFISKIKDNKSNFTDEEWFENDEKHQKFLGDWHKKFKDEFTFRDDIKLTRYQF